VKKEIGGHRRNGAGEQQQGRAKAAGLPSQFVSIDQLFQLQFRVLRTLHFCGQNKLL
jgi:hypothetical protein